MRAAFATIARATLAAVGLTASMVALADGGDGRVAVLAQLGVEDDADEFGNLLLRGGALFGYRSHLQHWGVALQNAHYSQAGWSEDVTGVVGLYRNQRSDTLEGLRAEGGIVSVAGHARPVGDVTWSHRPRGSTGLELIAAGDVVGTRAAIERGITYGLLAASVEQQFGERVTGILLGGWQPFTDGNSRALLRARLIVALLPEQGLSFQARWRQYRSSDPDVDGAYFNPDEYRNWDAGLSLRRRVGEWTVAGLAGAGRERVDTAEWQTTGIAELRAEGPLAGRARIAVSVLYSRAAGFVASDDYWYGSASVNVIVPLAR
jgi:hypothetical protein